MLTKKKLVKQKDESYMVLNNNAKNLWISCYKNKVNVKPKIMRIGDKKTYRIGSWKCRNRNVGVGYSSK